MELVLAFRRFEAPVPFAEFRGIRSRAPWCFDLYDLTYHGSFQSRDGRRMVCRYMAPDAESVRIPSRQHAVPFERITTVDVEGPARDAAVGNLCARIAPGEAMVAAEGSSVPALEALGSGARHLLTYRARDGQGDLHLFSVPRPPGETAAVSRSKDLWDAGLYLPEHSSAMP